MRNHIVNPDTDLIANVQPVGDAPTGNALNVAVSNDGGTSIPVNDSMLDIAAGNRDGTFGINKFGRAPDFDTTDLKVTIWNGADDAGLGVMRYTYSATANITTVSSSSAADTANLEVQGLDANYDLVVQTVTMQGQAQVPLTTPLIRVFRMKYLGAVTNAGTVYCYFGAAASGVPSVSANVRALFTAGYGQTEMALFTVPANHTAYMTKFYVAQAGGSRTTSYEFELRARSFGQSFLIKHHLAIPAESGPYSHEFRPYNSFSEKTDIELQSSLTETGVIAAEVSGGFDLILVAN